jgi:hypothetical protein
MDASSVKTPDAYNLPDRSVETPVAELGSDAQELTGNMVLLVEDNAINMRVRQPYFQVPWKLLSKKSSNTCTDLFPISF